MAEAFPVPSSKVLRSLAGLAGRQQISSSSSIFGPSTPRCGCSALHAETERPLSREGLALGMGLESG